MLKLYFSFFCVYFQNEGTMHICKDQTKEKKKPIHSYRDSNNDEVGSKASEINLFCFVLVLVPADKDKIMRLA